MAELLVGPVVPVPATDLVRAALVGAEVTARSAGRASFALTFVVEDPEGEWSNLLAEGYFDPGTRVIVVALRPAPSVLVDGVVTGQRMTMSRAGNSSTFVVTGEDLGLLMDLLPSELPFPTRAVEAQVPPILARYATHGIIPDVVDPPISGVPAPRDQSPSARRRTDYGHLTTLAELVGHVLRLEPGPAPGQSLAYWGPEIRDVTRPPPIVVGSGCVEEARFLLDGLLRREVVVTAVTPDGISIPVPVPDVGALRPPLAARPAPKLRLEIVDVPPGVSVAHAAAIGLGAAAAKADAAQAEGTLHTESYGQVLRPGAVVELQGAGPAHDGLYYVAQVNHRITSEGHDQGFALRREGLGAPAP